MGMSEGFSERVLEDGGVGCLTGRAGVFVIAVSLGRLQPDDGLMV